MLFVDSPIRVVASICEERNLIARRLMCGMRIPRNGRRAWEAERPRHVCGRKGKEDRERNSAERLVEKLI